MSVTLSTQTEKPRLVFVDLLRLFASLQMIQGHTIDAVLVDDARTGAWFHTWTWIRGLTAVSFMFASGVALYISGVADVERYRANPRAQKKRLRRAWQLLAIGYLLHFPLEWLLALLGKASSAQANAAVVSFAAVDVLQCNAICLFVLHGLSVSGLSSKQLVRVVAALSVLAIWIAPVAWQLAPTVPASFLLNYFTSGSGSLFPLFPWAGFVFGGVAIAAWVIPDGLTTDRSRAVQRLLVVGAVLVLVGKGAGLLCSRLALYPTASAYSAWPPFSFLRLGSVVLVCAVLGIVSYKVRRLPHALTVLAGESLYMYVMHLLILFSAGIGIGRIFRHQLSLSASTLLAAGMIGITFATAYLWARWRGRAQKEKGSA